MIMELQSSMKTTGSTNPATNLRPAAVVPLAEFFLPPADWVVVLEALPDAFAALAC
jgi:hypothetical protein